VRFGTRGNREAPELVSLSMNAHTWVDVALAFIAGLPAIIAAVSSVRNGRKIEKHNGELGRSIDRLDRRGKIGRN